VAATPVEHAEFAGTVIEALKRELAGYKVPKQVFFADELPRNSMGKVQKSVLREQFVRE